MRSTRNLKKSSSWFEHLLSKRTKHEEDCKKMFVLLESPTFITLFENDSITDINYPELLTAFYHYIIYMHIKKAYKN